MKQGNFSIWNIVFTNVSLKLKYYFFRYRGFADNIDRN